MRGRRLSVLLILSSILVLAGRGRAQSWVGHGPEYKAIKAVAISPQDTSVLFAGAFGWGVFKSTDGGSTWANKRVGLTNAYVRSIEPLSSTVVFCGTNDGVFKTTDGGESWALSLSTPFSVRSLAYDGQAHSLYAATFGSGLFKSADQGTSWTPVTVTDPVVSQTLTHQWAVAIFGRDSLFVGGTLSDVTTGGALFRSLDGGSTWIQVQRGVHIGSSIHSIAINPLAPSVSLIIGTATRGVYRSTNGGLNWFNVSDTASAEPLPDLRLNAVALSPDYRYAGTDSLGGFYSRSTLDATTGWTAGNGLPGASSVVSSIVINRLNRGTLFLGTEGSGVYRSLDAGFGWAARNTGMMGTAARVVRRTGNGRIILGTDLGDGLWISDDQGSNWSRAAGLTTANALTAVGITASPSVLYLGAYGAGVYKSTDGGLTWAGTDSTVINRFVRTLGVAPSGTDRVFAGTDNGVFSTTDGGASWQPASTGIPPRTSIRSMAVDPADPAVVFAGTDSSYLYKTTNAGLSWTHYTSANGFLPQDIFLRTITVDYSNHTTLYAGADSGRVYKSTTGGASWVVYGRMGATHSVRSILIHPHDHSIFFAATFGDGVFTSADSGRHWMPMSTGLPDSDIYTLESDQSTPLTLFAGSSDFGVYKTSYAFVDHAPVLSAPGNRVIVRGHALSFTVSASDPDATIPALAVSGLPSGASFTDSLNGHGAFAWTPGPDQVGTDTLTFYASDGSLSDSVRAIIDVLDSTAEAVALNIGEGWNLLSVPVVLSDFSKRAVFPDASSPAYIFSDAYRVSDTLKSGVGFWLKFRSTGQILFAGGTIALETTAVRAGWNIVGSVSRTIPADGVVPVPPLAITSSIFGYSASYVAADSIRPGEGYWLRANQSGQVILGAAAPPFAENRPVRAGGARGESGQRLGTLTFIDGNGGRSAELLLLSGAAPDPRAAEQFALPPMPPSGGFDVRFRRTQGTAAWIPPASGAGGPGLPIGIRTAGSRSMTLRWSLREPLTGAILTVGSGEHASRYELRGDGERSFPVSAGETNASLVPLQTGPAAAGAYPHTPHLGQNYPNPFNPATTIGYNLPFSADVRLVVFDLLGREIQELVRGAQGAGDHSVTWDASAAATGIYYYRLEAVNRENPLQSYRRTKTMLLIR